jgi:hypothetical protein
MVTWEQQGPKPVVPAIDDDGLHFTFDYDVSLAILRVHVEGVWDHATVASYYLQIKRFARPLRDRGEGLRLIVDMRHAALQPPEIAAQILRAGLAFFLPDDRIAFVAVDHATGGALEARYPGFGVRAFLSVDEARSWLQVANLH